MMHHRSFHYGWLIVVCGMLTTFSCLGLARFAFGMLLPAMQEGLALSYEQMGYLGTANFIGYLLAVAMTPGVLKRLRPRLTLGLSLVLIALTLAALSQATTFRMVLFLYLTTGIGSGLANISGVVLIAYWFRRDKRGRAAGLMTVGSGVAIIFSGWVVPRLNALPGDDGWRLSWLLFAAIVLFLALLIVLLVRNTPEELGLAPVGRQERLSDAELKGGYPRGSGRVLVLLGLLYLAFGLTYMVYGTFFVTSLVSEHGYLEKVAGQFWSWVGFFSLFSGILFGTLSDRIGRKRGLMTVFIVQTLAYLLAGSGLGYAALMLSVVLYGVTAWSIPAIMAAAVGDYLGAAKAAAGFSLITFFFAGGQVCGPAIAGIIAERFGSFALPFLLCALVTAGAALFTLTLPRTAPR
ncbi:MAG: MFS transporter [Pelovirga sp.]